MPKAWDTRFLLGILSFAILIILFTYKDYGVSWDEPVYNFYGGQILKYYLYDDPGALTAGNIHLYGGLYEVFATVLSQYSPLGKFETRHLVNALYGLFGIVGTFFVGRHLFGSTVGLLAAALLLLLPNYFGHMFNNSKDIPFAVGYIWSVYFIILTVQIFPKFDRKIFLRLSLALWITLGIRIGGVILVLYLGFFLGLKTLYLWQTQNRINMILKTTGICAGSFTIAYLLSLLTWPWAQQSLLNGLKALQTFSAWAWTGTYLYKGQVFLATELPKDYLFHSLAIKLPIWFLLFLAIGAGAILFRFYAAKNKFKFGQEAILFSVICLPIIAILYKGTVVHDGIRHFLFLLPLFSIIAALGVTIPFSFKKQSVSYAALGGLVIVLAVHLKTMVDLHPYQYIFFNRFAGGVEGAYENYEIDYWSHSYREATLALNDFVVDENKIPSERAQPWDVFVCGSFYSAAYYFPKKTLRRAAYIRNADFLISYRRTDCMDVVKQLPEERLVGQIKRRGVPLTDIYDLRGYRQKGNIRSVYEVN